MADIQRNEDEDEDAFVKRLLKANTDESILFIQQHGVDIAILIYELCGGAKPYIDLISEGNREVLCVIDNLLRGLELEELIKQCDEGDNSALLLIVNHCIRFNIEVPVRFKVAFDGAISRWIDADVKSLDQAFKVERPKNWHQKARNREASLMPDVYEEVTRLHQSGLPIDEFLFEQVGNRFGLGKTKVSEYFYLYRDKILPATKTNKNETMKKRINTLQDDSDYVDFVRKISKLPRKL